MVVSYGLRARLARAALITFLLFPPSRGTFSAAQTASAPAPQQTLAEKIAESKGLLDINAATADQLKALPGMGDAYVRRVVAGRPYTAKNQLTTRGILPTAEYERIRELIIAHRPKTR